MKLKWNKRKHPIDADKQEKLMDEIDKQVEEEYGYAPQTYYWKIKWPRWQWVCWEDDKQEKARFSIIYPHSGIGWKMYELYDGEETYRFKTLKEAKQKAEELSVV